MKSRRRFIPIVILLVLVLAGAAWYLAQPSNIFHGSSAELSGSGTIEGEELAVTAEVGGRVVELVAHEGDSVAANAVVARLDSVSASADLAGAKAALAQAQARRDLARNGARPEDKAQADAAVAQALAARDGAKRAWDDALTILNNPQDLEAQIASARAQVATTNQQIEAAKAQVNQAQAGRAKYAGDGSDLGKTMYTSFDLQVQAAQENVLAATAQRDGAQTGLDDLLAVRANPLQMSAQVHQAEARYHEADAAVAQAQAARDLLYAGSTKEDLAMAQAAVAQAQAAVDGAQTHLDKLTLRAPAAGLVSQRTIEIGQVIAPGTTAFTLVDPKQLTLTVYIPEDQIGRVHLDSPARVSVDSFPGRVYSGRVIFISPQAEFTPKNVQTVQDRASQVFAVKLRLDNPDNTLKPGMPADAIIGE